MNEVPKRVTERLLSRIADVSGDLDTLRKVQMEVAAGGVASATLSAGGGSKSYTRLDLSTIQTLIRQKTAELASLRARLNGSGPIRRIQFIRGAF